MPTYMKGDCNVNVTRTTLLETKVMRDKNMKPKRFYKKLRMLC